MGLDPQLPRSPMAGQGTPQHMWSLGDPPPPSSHMHPTWHPTHGAHQQACPAAPTTQRGHVDGCGGHGTAWGDRGDRARWAGQRGGGSHPQPCSISFELPPPGAPAMAMLMDQVRVFCTPLLLLFLSSACTQPLPTALREQQSNLWLCPAMHQGPVGG